MQTRKPRMFMTVRFLCGAAPRAIIKESSCCCLLLVGARLYLKLAYHPKLQLSAGGLKFDRLIQRRIQEEAPGFSQLLAQGLLGDP
jgi:hypothetical protein